MALDVKEPMRRVLKDQYSGMAQIVAAAQRDPDPVTMLAEGTGFDDPTSDMAIFAVKGRDNYHRVFASLCEMGLCSSNDIPSSADAPAPATRPLRVYLAGPMTGIVDDNKDTFNRAAAVLRAAGLHVENPAENTPPNDNPTWDDWMAIAIPQLESCDAVVMLPGWDKSKGAAVEYDRASALGKAIYEAHQALVLVGWAVFTPERIGPPAP